MKKRIPFCHGPSRFIYYPSNVTIIKIPEHAPDNVWHFLFATYIGPTFRAWIHITDHCDVYWGEEEEEEEEETLFVNGMYNYIVWVQSSTIKQ